MRKLFEYILYLKYDGGMLSHWSGYLTYDYRTNEWIVNAGRYQVVTEYDVEIFRIPESETNYLCSGGYNTAAELCRKISDIPIDYDIVYCGLEYDNGE